MRRSSVRGYVEPIAAIAAVFAVGVGLTVYAGGLQGALAPDSGDTAVAETVLSEIAANASTMGVLDPSAVRTGRPPAGWSANVTLSTREGRWQTGPTPPARADSATRRVSVRLAPGTVRPGRLTVEAWR